MSQYFPSLKAFLLFFACIQTVYSQIDRTLESNAEGEDVVDAVVSKIGSLFGNDHHFLKRLAYVDTQFGNKSSIGGIWHVSEANYDSTKVRTDIQGPYSKINSQFGIQWRKDVTWSDLTKPLYSGLALHLFLYINHKSALRKGFPKTIQEQATFRSKYVTRNDPSFPSARQFQLLVEKFEGEKAKQRPNAKMDLVVVLQASPTIGGYFYGHALQAIHKLFQLFPLPPVRLGFVVFSDHAEVRLALKNDITAEDLHRVDTSRPKMYEFTHTNAGIQAAYQVFRSATPRPEAPKIMVVFSQGYSYNRGDNGQNLVPAVANASAEGVTIYGVGIDVYHHEQGLVEIAQGRADHVFKLKYGHGADEVLRAFSSLYRRIGSQIVDLSGGKITDEILGNQEHRLYRYPSVAKNFRIVLISKSGQVEAYYGNHKAINAAWNDGTLLEGTNNVESPKTKPKDRDSRFDTEANFDYNIYDIPQDYYHEDDDTRSSLDDGNYLYIRVVGSESYSKYDIEVQDVDVASATPKRQPR